MLAKPPNWIMHAYRKDTVDSLSDGDRVEAILKEAGIEANMWVVLHHNEEHIEKPIWRNRVGPEDLGDDQRD